MKSFTAIASISLLTLNIIFFGCTDNKDEKINPENKPQTQEQTQVNSEIPKIGQTWNAIEKENIDLKKIIETNELEEVHKLAFSISDLVNSLPGQSKGLPSDKMYNLKQYAKEVEKSAVLLDEYGDAGDLKNTTINYEAFNKLLEAIKSLYTAESF